MSAMNSFEHTESGLLVRDHLRRGSASADARQSSQDAECVCPELCCVDHDN